MQNKIIQTDLGIFTHIPILRRIQAYSDIIGHIQTNSGIIQAYFETCVTQSWHIQNSGIFKIMAYSKPEAHSELWYIQN